MRATDERAHEWNEKGDMREKEKEKEGERREEVGRQMGVCW